MKKLKKEYKGAKWVKDELGHENWNHFIDYKSNLSLKEFSEEERRNSTVFNIVTWDKTDDARTVVIRKVNVSNIYTIYPERGERHVDLTFLMHKALKIIRENPDLGVEIIMVSRDSYDYDEYDGTFAPANWFEDDGETEYPEEKKKKKKANASKT